VVHVYHLSFWHAYKNTVLDLCAIYYSWWGKQWDLSLLTYLLQITAWSVDMLSAPMKIITPFNSGSLHEIYLAGNILWWKAEHYPIWFVTYSCSCTVPAQWNLQLSEVRSVTSKPTFNPNLYLATEWGDKPVYWPQGWVWGEHDKPPDPCFNEYAETHGSVLCRPFGIILCGCTNVLVLGWQWRLIRGTGCTFQCLLLFHLHYWILDC